MSDKNPTVLNCKLQTYKSDDDEDDNEDEKKEEEVVTKKKSEDIGPDGSPEKDTDETIKGI